MDPSNFPRVSLGHLPTPLELAPALTWALGGPRLFVKRDDCTGLALGGNKTRKLEFTMAAAIEQCADLIITSGGTQSNHVRQTAAAAAKLGLECQCVVANPLLDFQADYVRTGNVLLDRLLGVQLHVAADTGQATNEELARLVAQAQRAGRRPYVIPVGASDAVGSLGYVNCAIELLEQCAAGGIDPSHIVVATGSAGTHAGLLTGLRLHSSAIEVLGVAVSETAAIKTGKVRRVVDQLVALLGAAPDVVSDRDIQVLDAYVGRGYAIPAPETIHAVRLAAQTEALILDPVYTGKAMAGLIDVIRARKLHDPRDVIFMHTGGSPGLFAYSDALTTGALVS
jgi:L-cysteate sulfo-lyase